MELPQKLKSLYNHWPLHTEGNKKRVPEITTQNQNVLSDILVFVKERMQIWEQKEQNKPQPWTSDPILSKYRFCNIFRELDRQTIEFHCLLKPLTTNFPLWLLNMFYCRLVANPETVKEIGLLSFNQTNNQQIKNRLLNLPRPKYGTPYVFPISVIQKSAYPTRETFLCEYLPFVIHFVAEEIKSFKNISVANGLKLILPKFGFNLSFLWTEVLIDVAYQYPELVDLFQEFPIGPGALPTLKKLGSNASPSLLVKQLANLSLHTSLTYLGKPVILSAENWEGIACEYRKYTNLKAGKGRKRRYK